jgi:hypothetical protein
MEKNLKFTAKELFEGFEELNQDEINELYKALIAYSIGSVDFYTSTVDDALENVIDYYFDRDDICSFINQDLFDKAIELLEK